MRCVVWLDHRQAVLVRPDGDEVTTEDVASGVEPRTRRAGGSAGITATAAGRARGGKRTSGPQDALAEDRLDRKYDQALRQYYRRVGRAMETAGSILIMAPGEAPGELAKVLDLHPGLSSRVVAVETTDKMTRPQVVARVRSYFGKEPRRRGRLGRTNR